MGKKEMTSRLSKAMGPIFLLLIVSGCCLAGGIPSSEEKQTSEILKRLEAKIEKQEARIENQDAKIEKQEAVIDELRIKNERTNRTEEAFITIKDTELFSASGDKAVRDLPYIMMCVYRGSSSGTGIIAFDKLTLDYSNCDRPGGGCSAMDIVSGTFTAQTGGLYTVTFSGQADLVSDSVLILYLRQNGIQVEESVSFSKCGVATEHIEEMFSRTLIVSLGVGDTLDMEATRNDETALYFLTFCVSLIAFPYGH